jgi:hypothetical protein
MTEPGSVAGAPYMPFSEARKNFLEDIKGHLSDRKVVQLLDQANAQLHLSTMDKSQIADKLFSEVHKTMHVEGKLPPEAEKLQNIFFSLDEILSSLSHATMEAAEKAGITKEGSFTKAKNAFLRFCASLESSGSAFLISIAELAKTAIHRAKNKKELQEIADNVSNIFAESKMETHEFKYRMEQLVGEFFQAAEEEKPTE